MKIIDERERQRKKNTKTEKNKGVTQALVKVGELNNCVERLIKVFSN